MSQIFHPSTNTLSRVSIFGAIFFLAALGWVLALFFRSSYATQVGVARAQPVNFSHLHHVRELGIDCRYCHTSVEDEAFAGIPPTETCMTCHSQIWTDSPQLEPVRQSFQNNTPLPWTRVHDLPDFVYFDHSIHVQKGVGCAECHGEVDRMPLMWREKTLHMEWCLECHRAPQDHLRPRDKVFEMEWPAEVAGEDAERDLMEAHFIGDATNCSVCHR